MCIRDSAAEERHPETSTAASAAKPAVEQRQATQRQHAELPDTRLAAEAMTQPANAPTSRIAPAEQVATRPAQEPSQRCTHGGPTTLQQALPPAAAEHWDRPATAEDVATLERQATQRQDAELPERIVHAFLDNLPLTDDQSARRVTEILEDETTLSDDALKAIAEVFECAFIWYTDPHQRTAFVHRDTLGYVRAWQKLASFRSVVGKTAYFDGTHLSPTLRQTVFHAYLDDFASTPLRPGQQTTA